MYNARVVSAKYGCRIGDVPKYFAKHLIAWSERNRERNAPIEAWLREHGIYEKAKRLLQTDPRATLIAFTGSPFADGKPHARIYLDHLLKKNKAKRRVRFTRHQVQLFPVNTPAQLREECERFKALWPSSKAFAVANKRAWQLLDLYRATAALMITQQRINGENLIPLLYFNEMAEAKEKPGISIRTFRRRYNIYHIRDAKRRARQNALENPDESKTKTCYSKDDQLGLDKSELAGMIILSATGHELPNPYSDAGDD